MPQLLPNGKQQYFDDNGLPLVGGQLFTYATRTSTPLQTTSDAAGLVPNPNPVILDARGEAIIFWSGNYTVTLEDALGNLIWTVNDVDAGESASGLTRAEIGAVLYPQSAAELAASVLPTDYSYPTSPHDIRRYGFVGDGATDDAPAWAKLALVVQKGGNGLIPPGPTFLASQVTFFVPTSANGVLYGYGVQIYTNNSTANPHGSVGGLGYAIDGLRFSGGGNSNGLTVYGLTYNQVDNLATGGLVINAGSSVTLQDCACLVSSTVLANANFACVKVTPDYPGGAYGYWNRIINLDVRQASGNGATYAPFAILLTGIANATTIRDCRLTSCSYLIGLYANAGGGIANAVVIDGNAFEGGTFGILANGLTLSGSTLIGLRVTNNRAESLTGGFIEILGMNNGYAYGSFDPPWLAGNALVSSAFPYLTQSGGTVIHCNSMDFNSVASSPQPGMLAMYTNGPLSLQSIASTGGVYDALIAQVQTAPGGIVLNGPSGSVCAALQWNGTNGQIAINGVKVVGTQIAGYGAPTGGAKQVSFAAGSITLPLLAAAVAQLINDLRSHGLLAV